MEQIRPLPAGVEIATRQPLEEVVAVDPVLAALVDRGAGALQVDGHRDHGRGAQFPRNRVAILSQSLQRDVAAEREGDNRHRCAGLMVLDVPYRGPKVLAASRMADAEAGRVVRLGVAQIDPDDVESEGVSLCRRCQDVFGVGAAGEPVQHDEHRPGWVRRE